MNEKKYLEKNANEFLFGKETYEIIGICMEIHRVLGHGFLESVYKDALVYELTERNIRFEREKEYKVLYKGTTLAHKFIADFVIENKLILEIKAADSFVNANVAQVINYLKISGCQVGLLVNFGKYSLEHRRLTF